MERHRNCALIAILLTYSLTFALAATNTTSTTSGGVGNCQPLSSEFDFPKRPPAKATDLAFCKEYKSHTCCDKTSTLSVLRSLSPLFQSDSDISSTFSERCRQLSSTIACSPCHPEVGTKARVGICPCMCDEWYFACRDGLYTEVDGILRPCTDASLICAPLSSIVTGGKEFCERTGVGAGVVNKLQPLEHEISALVSRSDSTEDEPEQVLCFDGTIPSGTRADGAGPSTTPTTPAEDAGSARKRYYKTAEELAEIEKRRAKRAEQEAQRAWEEHPVYKLAKRFESTVRGVMAPINREWGRLVRKLPGPKWLKNALSSTFALSIVLMLVNTLMWSLWKSWIDSLINRCCRGGGRGGASRTASLSSVPLSSSGLSPDDVRSLRIQKLMQDAYTKSGVSKELAEAAAAAKPKAGFYTTVIDGEVVELPE